MELDTQSGPAVINQVVDDHFDGTNKVEAREAGVKKAREHSKNLEDKMKQ